MSAFAMNINTCACQLISIQQLKTFIISMANLYHFSPWIFHIWDSSFPFLIHCQNLKWWCLILTFKKQKLFFVIYLNKIVYFPKLNFNAFIGWNGTLSSNHAAPGPIAGCGGREPQLHEEVDPFGTGLKREVNRTQKEAASPWWPRRVSLLFFNVSQVGKLPNTDPNLCHRAGLKSEKHRVQLNWVEAFTSVASIHR